MRGQCTVAARDRLGAERCNDIAPLWSPSWELAAGWRAAHAAASEPRPLTHGVGPALPAGAAGTCDLRLCRGGRSFPEPRAVLWPPTAPAEKRPSTASDESKHHSRRPPP